MSPFWFFDSGAAPCRNMLTRMAVPAADALGPGHKMSFEQDQVVAGLQSEQAAKLASMSAAEAPARRRIVVAQKPAEKPIAFISRDSEQAEQFEQLLGRSRGVVVFPSLTHFCTDPSRAAWGGVVIARSCGWDERLLGFVPATSCIAFWRVAEEGYGWPASIRKLDTQDDIGLWLEELSKPLPFQLPRGGKRAVDPNNPRSRAAEGASTRGSVRRSPAKPQLKFELATARGVVSSVVRGNTRLEQETPAQMELNGLAGKRAEQLALGGLAAGGESAASPAPELSSAAKSIRPSARSERPAAGAARARASTSGEPGRRAKAAVLPASALHEGAAPVRRRGRPPADKQLRVESLFADEPQLSRQARFDAGPVARQGDETGFMKMAAELGLARAAALLDELRLRAHSLLR